MFRVDPKTVTRWAKAGKLTSIRTLGGHRRYREPEVRALLAGIPRQASRLLARNNGLGEALDAITAAEVAAEGITSAGRVRPPADWPATPPCFTGSGSEPRSNNDTSAARRAAPVPARITGAIAIGRTWRAAVSNLATGPPTCTPAPGGQPLGSLAPGLSPALPCTGPSSVGGGDTSPIGDPG